MAAVSASASAARDSWAYLQRCVHNRGDGWTVSARLLGDVLRWAGPESLEYALFAIGGGSVARPLPYLRRVLAAAVARGRSGHAVHPSPEAAAVSLCRRLAPSVVISDVEPAAPAGSASGQGRSGSPASSLSSRPGSDCRTCADSSCPDGCAGLMGSGGDDYYLTDSESLDLDSSPGSRKADATPPAGCPAVTPAPVDPRPAESRPCGHPLLGLVTARMGLDGLTLVDCALRCGHRLYSNRGPIQCPCHWPSALVVRLSREFGRSSSAPPGC